MFTTKIDRSNGWASSAVRPSATTIETIAISSGTSPATTAPKTSRRMISAAGSPNCSSPFSRSSCERRLKSWSSVWSPVTETEKASSSSAASTALDHRLRLVLVGDRRAGRSSRDGRRRRGVASPSRYVRARASACRSLSTTSARTNASNSGESTVYRSERTITMSLTRPRSDRAGTPAPEPPAPARTQGCSSARRRW